ncbi:MAG: hypothetical protein EAZ06_01895 [Cytophagales bacterium]|nr:MAG: hypothetical protein EAZ06_01895 [Cytophagales bacterium]
MNMYLSKMNNFLFQIPKNSIYVGIFFYIVVGLNLIAQNTINDIQNHILKLNYEQKEDFLNSISEDSLRILTKTLENPLIKIDVNNALALKMMFLKVEQATILLEQNYKDALRYDYTFGQYWSIRLQSWLHQLKSEFSTTKSLLFECLKKAQKINYTHGEALCYRYLAELSEKQNFYRDALEYYHKSIDIHEKTNNMKGLATDYWRLSIFYDKLENYELAIEMSEKSLEYAKKIHESEWIIRNYNKIGLSYEKQGNTKKALEYLNEGNKIYQQKPNKETDGDFAMNLHALAKTYANKSNGEKDSINNKKTIDFFHQSMNWQEKKFKRIVPETYIEVGKFFNKINQLDSAVVYFEKGQIVAQKQQNHSKYAVSLVNYAQILFKQNNIEKALIATNKAYQFVKEKKLLSEQVLVTQLLANIYEKKGNIEQAFFFQKEYQLITDSLRAREGKEKNYEMYQQKLWQEQQTKIVNKKEQEKLKQENELDNYKLIRNIAILGFSGALFGILIIGILYQKQKKANKALKNNTKEIEKQKKELIKRSEVLEKAYNKLTEANLHQENLVTEIKLQKDTINQINKNLEDKILERTQTLSQALSETARLNAELDAFLYHASHDLRRPVTTLFGLYELGKMTLEDEGKGLYLLNMMEQTAFNMDKMLTKLIMIHEINNVKRENIKRENIKFGEIIQNMYKIYANQIHEKNIDWKIKIEKNLNFLSDKSLCEFIIQNLIENAIIFSQGEKPFISIKFGKKNNFLHIKVEDNGQGIEKELQNRIFEMYFRGSEHSQGNGLGLYVVHRAVYQLKGFVEFESEVASGSIFEVYLPYS